MAQVRRLDYHPFTNSLVSGQTCLLQVSRVQERLLRLQAQYKQHRQQLHAHLQALIRLQIYLLSEHMTFRSVKSARNLVPRDQATSHTNRAKATVAWSTVLLMTTPAAVSIPLPSQQHPARCRETDGPTIAEEPQGRLSSESSHQIPRKPSPGHSRQASGELAAAAAGVAAAGAAAVGVGSGYRRSLDPPSSDNSPARTPGLENASQRRLSEGLAAETVQASEAPDVEDQAVEMRPTLLQPSSELSMPDGMPASSGEVSESELQGPTDGYMRARAGTDFSMREADIAQEVNSSPERDVFDPKAAQAEKESQAVFLQTHELGQPSNTGASDSRSSSPSKGRVRELADKYQQQKLVEQFPS